MIDCIKNVLKFSTREKVRAENFGEDFSKTDERNVLKFSTRKNISAESFAKIFKGRREKMY